MKTTKSHEKQVFFFYFSLYFVVTEASLNYQLTWIKNLGRIFLLDSTLTSCVQLCNPEHFENMFIFKQHHLSQTTCEIPPLTVILVVQGARRPDKETSEGKESETVRISDWLCSMELWEYKLRSVGTKQPLLGQTYQVDNLQDIVTSSMDEFSELLSSRQLTETQVGVCRDIRRRGKNKVHKSVSVH